jgi:short-subunit dehydrogenase
VAETALVTGASSGIGEEFARALSARGYDLVLVARREERLRALAGELPTEAQVLSCDLSREAASVPARLAELGAEVDLLVNNAGFGSYGLFHQIPEGREAEMVRVNCEAVVTLTRAFLPGMVERRRGGVIMVGSISGNQPLPYTATYSASKAFVQYLGDALHHELRGTGVRILTVNPGPVPTEWSSVSGIDSAERGVPQIPAAQVVAEALEAFDRGKRTVVPGRAVKAFVGLTKPSPRAVQLRVSERMYRPRS